jgi:hypothetical protein
LGKGRGAAQSVRDGAFRRASARPVGSCAMVLKIGKGADRTSIRRALKRGGALTVSYKNVLDPEDIREILTLIHEAGDPETAMPLLAWLASHPNSPADVLKDIATCRNTEVLESLAMNRDLPKAVERSLRRHASAEVRERVAHILSKRRS